MMMKPYLKITSKKKIAFLKNILISGLNTLIVRKMLEKARTATSRNNPPLMETAPLRVLLSIPIYREPKLRAVNCRKNNNNDNLFSSLLPSLP